MDARGRGCNTYCNSNITFLDHVFSCPLALLAERVCECAEVIAFADVINDKTDAATNAFTYNTAGNATANAAAVTVSALSALFASESHSLGNNLLSDAHVG